MRSYNRRHLVAQLALFAFGLAACFGAGAGWWAVVVPVLVGGAFVVWLGSGLAREWNAYAKAQDVAWQWDHRDEDET